MSAEKSCLSSFTGWLAIVGILLMMPGLLLAAWVRYVFHLPIPTWGMWLLAALITYHLFQFLVKASGGSRLWAFIVHWALGTATFFALLLVVALAPKPVANWVDGFFATAVGYYLPS